jgi:hypothetical protein
MLRLLRIALLLVIAIMVSGVAVGLVNDTGPFEKVVLLAVGAGLVWAAVMVNRIGAVHHADG